MTPLQEFAFFFVLGLVGLAALIVVVVAVAAVHFWQQDMRHLRARAREAAPALDEAITEAVGLRVVCSNPAATVVDLESWRRNGSAA